MAIEAQLADGRVLEFPDGTDPSVVQSTVKRLLSEAPAAAPPAKPTGTQFFGEFAKGAKRAAVVDLPTMWESAGLFKDVGALSTINKRINYFDQIDKGEVTSADQLQGLDISAGQARSYLAASPEGRAKIRENVLARLSERKDMVNTALKTIEAYQEDAKNYKPLVDKPRNIGSTTDFVNWLGSTMGSGAVQMAPILLAAAATGGAGLAVTSMGMGTAESVGRRLEYIKGQTKGLPPDKQADAIVEYLRETGDTTLLAGIASGSLDAILGPAARLVKIRAGDVAKAATRTEAAKRELKRVPGSIAGEGATGAAQQAIQLGADVQLKEKPKFWTRENIIDILEAGATEAAGSLVGAGVPVAAAAARRPEGAAVEEPPAPPDESTAPPAPPAPPDESIAPPAPPRAPVSLDSQPRLNPAAQIEGLSATLPFVGQDEAAGMVALRNARAQLALERADEQQPFVFRQPETSTPQEARLVELFNDLLSKGMPPEEAKIEAQRQLEIEVAESQEIEQGEPSVARPIESTSGESASVASEPPAGPPAAGVGEPQRLGVDAVGAPAGEPDVGAGTQPDAVTLPEIAAAPEVAAPPVVETPPVAAAPEVAAPPVVETPPVAAPPVVETPPVAAAPEVATAREGKQPDAVGKTLEELDAEVVAQDKAEQERRQKAVGVGLANVDAPFDFRRDYPSLEDAIQGFRQNVVDTLQEQGETEPFFVYKALDAFDRAVEERRKKEAPPATAAPKTETVATEPVVESDVDARAPAVSEAPKTRRGRPKVERTPEQQAQQEEQRKESRRAVANAEYGLQKATEQLDKATTPINEDDFESDDALKEAQQDQRAYKRDAIKQLLTLADTPGIRNTAVHKRIKELLKDSRISQKEIDDIKRGLEVTRKTLSDKGNVLSRLFVGVAPINEGLAKVTNANQALSAIIKNGSPFQRLLAGRMRGLLNDVRVVVLEKDTPIPKEMGPYLKDWNRANGMYVPSLDAVYLRGASFGGHQGVNNVTALHELLHAATIRKIGLGIKAITKGMALQKELQKSVVSLFDTMDIAKRVYDRALAAGRVSRPVQRLIERTNGAALEDPYEFVSYGMTDPDFQLFLMQIPVRANETVFSSFVRAVMRMFGIGPDNYTAFTNLVNVTDTIMSTRVSEGVAEKILYRQDKPFLQANEKEAEADAVRSAAQLKKDMDKALDGLRKSKASEMHKHVGALQKARDAGSIAKIVDVLYSKADYKTRQLLANAVSFDFLARWTEKTLPPIKDAYNAVQKLVGHTAQVQEAGLAQIQMLDQDFKADPTLEAKLNDILPLVTIVQVDPSNPNAAEREPRLDQMYAELGENGQRVYKRIIGFHENLREYQEFLLDKNIKDLPGLSDEVKQNLLNQIYQKFQAERRIEPYLPLVRDPGEFWLAVGRDDNTQIYTYETREEREADLERIRREDYNNAPLEDLMGSREIAVGNELKELRGQVDISGSLLPKLFDAIDKNVPPNQQDAASVKDTNDQLKNDIFDIWLTMLPEQAFRRQFAQRKARAGYRPDIRRNLASHVSRIAPLLSRLKFGNDLRAQETRLRELVRYSEHLTPFKQSVEERIRGIMSPRGHSFWDSVAGGANKLTYLTYLTGASTALLQPFGLLISGIPILTANHKANPATVVKELLKNAAYFKQYGVVKKLPDGRTEYVAPSLTNNRNLPEDERRAIQAMAASNVVNQTYTGFLWDVAKGEDLNVTKSKGAKLADFLLNALLRNTERLTREALYLASYRLGRGRGLSEAEAIEQAIADTKESLGDYDMSGRPTWMQGPAGRVIFSMKMYPVIMIQQLFGSMYKMLPALNKEGKAQALTKFSGLMMTTAMLAGMYNMPFADLIITTLTQFLGEADDEDMPEELKNIDPVLWFKTVWMPSKLGSFDILGVPLNEIIGEGAISAAAGMNIGQRIGLNDLWARDGKPSASTPEAMASFIESYFGGPLWSYGKSVAKAMDDFAIGDYQRAVERVVPLAPARNLLTAQRAATEGYETPRGTIVDPENVSAADTVWQSMGFTPGDVAAARETSFKLTGAQQTIMNKRALLMRRIKFADKKEDLDKLGQLYEEDVPKFNTRHPEFKITPAQIGDVLREQRKQLATSRAGVTVDKKNLRLFDESVSTMEDRLERRQQ